MHNLEFLSLIGMVTFLPFVPVYMEQLGLSSFQIGIVRTVQPVGTIIACPLWGAVADRFGIHRKLVITGIVIGGSATFATYFTPTSVHSPGNDTSWTTQAPSSLDSTYITFSVVMTLAIVSILFLAHVTPTVDSNVMLLLKDFPDTDYGRQRLWGAAGWGSFAAITGLAMDTYIKYVPDGNRFLPAYIIFLALMIPAVIPVSLMRFPKHTQPESISGGIWKLFKSLKVIIFFTVAGVGGLSLGVINTFQFLFLNDLNAPSLVMGLTLTFTCLSEIPFMFAAGRIIKWTGEETVFAMALACYTLRFFLYAILRNPWLILPIELLHGICFGAMWPAMTSFANKVAPPGMGATVQNLVSAVSMGAGKYITKDYQKMTRTCRKSFT